MDNPSPSESFSLSSFIASLLKPSQTPEEGGVYIMYHGTSIDRARSIIDNGFSQSTEGMLGIGVYVSRDPQKASRYPLKSDPSERVVLKLSVKVGRVKRIDVDNHPMQFTWHEHGYDTAWVPPNCGMKCVRSGLQEDCVFDPKRIRITDVERAPPSVLQELQQRVMASQVHSRQTPEKKGVYTMYHGTSVSNAMSIIANGFVQSTNGMLGRGVYLSREPEDASQYPISLVPSERLVLKLSVKVGRVKRIDVDDHPMRFTWNEQGYDTAWVPPNCGMTCVPSGQEVDCVFNPKRIKVMAVVKAPQSSLPDLQAICPAFGVDIEQIL